MKPTHYGQIAAVIFAAEGAFAVTHLIVGGKYDHFPHLLNVIVDVGLAAIWLAAAVAVTIRHTLAAFLAVVVGGVATHLHGILFSTVSPGTGVGVPFLLASCILPVLAVRSAPAWTAAAREAEGRHAPPASLPRSSHA